VHVRWLVNGFSLHGPGFDLRAVQWNFWWRYWHGSKCFCQYFSFPLSVIISPMLVWIRGLKYMAHRFISCSHCIDLFIIIESGWRECCIIYFIFYFRIFFYSLAKVSSRLAINFCECRTEHLELPAVWMVIAAKDLGICLCFPQAGQYAKVALMQLLFRDRSSAKTMLRTSEKQYWKA